MSLERLPENKKTVYYRIKNLSMLIDQYTPKDEIQNLLTDLGWIKDEVVKQVTVPGEGNMNVVLRVQTDQGSFILKQSRSFVNKYPTLEAPIERIGTEYKFYQALGPNLGQTVPQVLAYSEHHHLLMLSDLGDCNDLSTLYNEREISNTQIESLVATLCQIHVSQIPEAYPDNLALRQLNNQHIFQLPFMESNGFDLDNVQEGLQELSMPYKANAKLKTTVNELGKCYLSRGSTLLHGDYYPGSWMQSEDNIYVIDPEFSFAGPAEFDLGVMGAHLIMITSDVENLEVVKGCYQGDIDEVLINQFTGVEIMRRLIGLAQLPLERTLSEKAALMKMAEGLLVG